MEKPPAPTSTHLRWSSDDEEEEEEEEEENGVSAGEAAGVGLGHGWL